MQELEPEAKTLGQALGEALDEFYPAAADAAEATAAVAEDNVAVAAAIE